MCGLFRKEGAGDFEGNKEFSEVPTIFINQARVEGDPRELDGIVEVSLHIFGGRPKGEVDQRSTVRISPEQWQAIDGNNGIVNPDNELGFVKDKIGLITPEASLILNKQQ